MGFTKLITESHQSLFQFYGNKLISPSDEAIYNWIFKADSNGNVNNKTLSNFKTFDGIISNSQTLNILLSSPKVMNYIVSLHSYAFTTICSNSNSFENVLASSTAMNIIASSSTAISDIIDNHITRSALFESSLAMSIVVKSSVAMSVIVKSSTAMAIIASSSIYMDYIVKSINALNEISKSTIAINSITLSDTALKAVVMNITAATVLENALQSNVSKIVATLTASRTLFIKSYTSASLIKDKDNIWHTDSNVFIIPSYFILNHGPVTYKSIFYSVLNTNAVLGSASCIGTNSKIYYNILVSLRGSRITFTYSGKFNLAGACFYTMFTVI